MKNSVLFFLIPLMLSLFVLSCDSENSDVIYNFNKFPAEVTLQGTNTNLNDFVRFDPSKALKFDSLIFIRPRRGDYPIHIFNYNDFNYIKPAGKIGKGPGEISIADQIFLKKNKELWIEDAAKKKIVKYPIDSILKSTNYLYKESIDIPKEIWVAGKGHFINDSTLIQHVTHKKGRFLIYRNKKIIDTLGELPKKKKSNIKERYYLHNYYTKGGYIPSKDIAIAAFMHYDIIELYDITTGKKIRKIVGPDNIEPVLTSNGIVHTSKSDGAYYGIKTDDKYIYLSYLGRTMLKEGSGYGGYKAAYPSQIHVHNFNGKPVMKIKLDREFVTFIIDRKKKIIITIGAEREAREGLFRIYKFPEKLL